MKIGLFVTEALYPTDADNTISGHIQVPLQTANILKKHGHEISIITTDAPDGYSLPEIVDDDIDYITVPAIHGHWQDADIDKFATVRLLKQLRESIISREFDRVHFFGTERVALLLSFLIKTGISAEAYVTISRCRPNGRIPDIIKKVGYSTIDKLFCLTEYSSRQLSGSNVTVTRPGISRDRTSAIASHVPFNKYVLFWRNADRMNGADICRTVYNSLSTEYPDIDFIYATRPGAEMEEIVKKDAKNCSNIHVLVHPYNGNLSIVDLITEASTIVLPFRSLSINPQFAVLESMAVGTPLITTAVESNSDIIHDRKNGFLIQPSEESLIQSLQWAIDHPNQSEDIGKNGKETIDKEWNWTNYEKQLIDNYDR